MIMFKQYKLSIYYGYFSNDRNVTRRKMVRFPWRIVREQIVQSRVNMPDTKNIVL